MKAVVAMSTAVGLILSCSVGRAASDPPIVVSPQLGHDLSIEALAISPDGRTIATGGYDKTVKLWNVATGRELRTLSGHDALVNSVAFSPDSRTIVSGSRDKKVRLWDATSGRELIAISGFGDPITSVAFSPDGRTVASASEDHTLKLWDSSSGKELRKLSDVGDAIATSIAFSPDGHLIATGSRDKAVKLWDAASGRSVNWLTGHTGTTTSVGFSPDGKMIVSAAEDMSLKLWDVASGRELRTISAGSEKLASVAFSPDGLTVLSVSDKMLKLWDVTTGRERGTLGGRDQSNKAAAFSPDGRFIVSANVNVLKLWDATSRGELRTLSGRGGEVSAVVFAPDGRTIAWDGTLGGLARWDVTTGRALPTLKWESGVGASFRQSALAFSPNGRTVIAAAGSTLIEWNLEAHRAGYLGGQGYEISSVAVARDGRIASGGSDKTIHVSDANGHELRTLAHGTWVTSVAFSPDGRTIASGSEDRSIKLWDVASGRELRTLRNVANNSVAFSPDGRLIASGWDKLKLWDVASGRELRALAGKANGVKSIAFSPDGRVILAGLWDKTLKLWDLASGRELRTFVGHSNEVNSVAFSPDGRTIISGSKDGTVRLWSARDGIPLATLVEYRNDEWITITPEGFFDASPNGARLLNVVRGLEAYGVDQFYQALYRPDLVREKLAGDPQGKVRDAASRVDLDKILASGAPPELRITAPVPDADVTGETASVAVAIADRGGGVGRVEWRVNGVTLGVEDRSSARGGGVVSVSRTLPLEEGDNVVEVVAYNARGLVASLPAQVRVRRPVGRAVKPRLFVLAVGVNDYADTRFKLNLATPDAKAIAEALTRAGKDLYTDVEVTLLNDGDVRRDKIDSTFAKLAGAARPSDVFVFFLAGHGKTVDGRYYFVPQDFALVGERTAANVNAAVTKQGIAQEQWQAWFATIAARKSVLLFDTCESGTLTGDAGTTQTLERGAGSDRLVQATGRSVLTAASGDADAIEGYRGHGLFTYQVLEALERADTDGSGAVDIAELAAYVHVQVVALSERVFNRRQVPQVRITANYPFAKTTKMFEGTEPGIVISLKATHRVSAAADLLVQPAVGAQLVRKLDAKTQVTLVKSEAGWTLVAREGRPLGYVATRDLVPVD